MSQTREGEQEGGYQVHQAADQHAAQQPASQEPDPLGGGEVLRLHAPRRRGMGCSRLQAHRSSWGRPSWLAQG